MAAFNKFNQFVADVGLKIHKLDTDVLKILLTNVAPIATNSVKANLTEIAVGNGYVAGGTAVASQAFSQTAGLAKLTGNDVVFTAAGGTIGPFRYAVLYNDTPTAPVKPLIGWWDNGSLVTLNIGDIFTVDLDQVNGIFTFQ